jgi:23S rRNA G2445 N2-methylase RlmL
VASDADARAVAHTRDNAREAGVELVVEHRGIIDLQPLQPPGFVVTNPPYGERLDAADALYEDMGRSLRRLRDHTIALLAGAPAIARAMRREPDRWWILYNGAIECRLLLFQAASTS